MGKATPVPVAPAAPAAAKTVTVAGVAREVPEITSVSNAIPIPERSYQRGSKSAYNFGLLTEIGMSFGVKNKTRAQVSPVVSRENKRNRTDTPDPTQPGKMISTWSARYEAFDVNPANDPDGAKVRVFRVG